MPVLRRAFERTAMLNDLSNRRLLRFAKDLRQRLAHQTRDHSLLLPESAWREARQISARLELCRQRHWHVATERLQHDALDQIRRLQSQLNDSLEACQELGRVPHISSLRDLLTDLRELSQEFEEVRLDLRERILTVVTDAIVLEEINLGRFEIVLDGTSINNSRPYRVVALDPRPASQDASTTHPHVHDELLCEGEGKGPIRHALSQGRVFDFFLLVRQILQTYNSGSAYVQLSKWDGVECHDCGYQAAADESSSCERCDSALCSDCGSSCSHCSRYCCSGCDRSCAECDSNVCHGCLNDCPGCHRELCPSCFSDSLCSACEADQPTEEIPDEPKATDAPPCEESSPETAAELAVHSVGVG